MKQLLKVFLIGVLVFTSCQEDNKPTEPDDDNINNGTILTSELTEAASQDVSPAGGTIKVTKAESPVNGLTISVPQNGYKETRNFIISTAEIKEHKLGENFDPITPMIIIKNGGGYSEMPMEVTVPITKASDEFAMGFLYNEITGEVEALPVLALSDNSITVSTRHFATSTISGGGLMKGNDASSLGNLIISSIKESTLNNQAIVSSGFTPGADDWEFINFGSYIADGGHCAGQAMTAMWYYYEKKLKGEGNLFHRYDKFNESDKPAKLWQDNPTGYRFASTIQRDFDWDGWIRNVNIQSYLPSLTWKAFITAILITGEPQSVIIKESATNAGHAMVVYKVNVNEGKLYIADPNYPNNRGQDGTESIRIINYTGGKLQPYASYLKVGDPGTVFDQIAFFGKTANIEWSKINERYAQTLSGTVGNDRFPAYNLYQVTKNGDIELKEEFITDADTIKFFCKSAACEQFLSNTDHRQVLNVYDTTGTFLAKHNPQGIVTLELKPGKNKFGLYVTGAKKNSPEFLDFKWITVYYQKLKIIPDDFSGKPGEDYELVASSGGTAPQGNAKYVWNFGDGTDEVTVLNDSTVAHTWENEGEYEVKVELYENSTGKKLGTAYADAEIAEEDDLMTLLHTMKKMTMSGASFEYTNDQGGTFDGGIHDVIEYEDAVLQWSGTSFTYQHKSEEEFNSSGDSYNYYTTVRGTFSADTKILETITYEYRHLVYWNYEIMFDDTEKLTITNIPQIYHAGEIVWGWGEVDDFRYELEENDITSHVSSLEWRWISEYGGHSDNVITKSHVNYFFDNLVIKFKPE